MNDKLINIQQELNVPKNLFNSFGGYAYRSAESILEAVKPLLKKYELSITLWDELVCVGSWNYVQASVEITDNKGAKAGSKAFAREQETKKGMDAAQITGSASSYARKYALNGLFAIDDTKDPDTNEQRKAREGVPSEDVLAKAKQKLFKAFKDNGVNDSMDMMATIQQATGKDVVETVEDAEAVIKYLEKDA